MVDRRGPVSGYDFGQKRQYRRNIYAQFKRSRDGHVSDKTIALLPSIEGDEIESALNAGFKERNICIIDRNPAIVATLKRRYRWIRTYGVSAADAAKRIVDDIGGVDFVNLDLCGPIGPPLFDTLRAWRAAGAIREGGQIAVTALRGRERGMFGAPIAIRASIMPGTEADIPDNTRDMLRLSRIAAELEGMPQEAIGGVMKVAQWAAAPHTVFLVRNGVYQSTAGSQTMLWGIWKIHSKACLCDECLSSFISQMTRGEVTMVGAVFRKVAILKEHGWPVDAFDSAGAGGRAAVDMRDLHRLNDARVVTAVCR